MCEGAENRARRFPGAVCDVSGPGDDSGHSSAGRWRIGDDILVRHRERVGLGISRKSIDDIEQDAC